MQKMDFAALKRYLQCPPVDFGAVPFWFLNHYAEESEVRKQVRDFAAKHFGGVMLHARDGLLGGYLNAHWKDTVSWVVDEAEKQGIKIWLYDELNYPSGPAGGKIFDVCPDTAMQSLELVSESEQLPDDPFDKIIKFNGKYLCFQIRYQRQYPDYLDKVSMREFIKLSYTWYADRFKKYFGTLIKGEFTDNSCANFGYYRRAVPWTPRMPELFREKTGQDLDEILPSLFLPTENASRDRIVFWRFLNDLYLNTFVIPIEEECNRNGIAATGHYCLETGTSEHVRQIGDRFDQKRHQHIPGVDMLGSNTWEGLEAFPVGTASAMLANTASPAYFFHGSRVLCECMGLSLQWGMTLAEMRRISGTLAALGIDFFVLHGLYYSIAGHRKRECIPDFYHNTLWEHIDFWTAWISRLNALTSCAEEHLADTALLYPVTAQQAGIELGLGPRYKDCGPRCDRIDRAWEAAGDVLVQNAIPFEIIDEKLLCNAKICKDELQIPLPKGGIHRIHTLILSSVWIIGEDAYIKLRSFAENGGCVIGLEDQCSAVFDGEKIVSVIPPAGFYTAVFSAKNRIDLEESGFVNTVNEHQQVSRVQLSNTGHCLTLREWIHDGQYFALIHNFSRKKLKNVGIECKFDPAIIDLDAVSISRAPKRMITKTFAYGETLLLTESAGVAEIHRAHHILQYFPVPVKNWDVEMEGTNAIALTEMKCFHQPADVQRKFEWSFEIASLPKSLGIALDMEPTHSEMRNGLHPFMERYENCNCITRCQVFVNGCQVRNIQFGTHFDRWICEGDILPFVKEGKNKVELVQPCELLEKSRTFPEPLLVIGNFGVRDGKIVPAPENLSSPCWSDSILKNYSGRMKFRTKICLPEAARNRDCILQFQEVHEILEVFVNGKNCGCRVMPPWEFKIPAVLTRESEIELLLKITNTPANRWQIPIVSGITGPVILQIIAQ